MKIFFPDQIDAEILNLTTRYFDLENQEALLLSTVENLEFLRPKVESFMNGKFDLPKYASFGTFNGSFIYVNRVQFYLIYRDKEQKFRFKTH